AEDCYGRQTSENYSAIHKTSDLKSWNLNSSHTAGYCKFQDWKFEIADLHSTSVGIVGPDREDASVGQLDIFEESQIGAVFRKYPVDRHNVASLQTAAIGTAQAGFAQRAGTGHFESPLLEVSFIL